MNRLHYGCLKLDMTQRFQLYRVIHEECHLFVELICHLMLMKKVHMNMGPIFNSFGKTSEMV